MEDGVQDGRDVAATWRAERAKTNGFFIANDRYPGLTLIGSIMLKGIAIGTVLAAIVLFSLFALLSSESFQECKAGQSETYSRIKIENLPKLALPSIYRAPTYIRCVGLITYEYRDAVTALATVFIALFTLTLWLATDKLWRSGQATFEAAERAFVFLDGFDTELSTGEDANGSSSLPKRYNEHPELYITRFAVLPRWKNGGNTPTKGMTVHVNWSGPGVTPDFKYQGTPKYSSWLLKPLSTATLLIFHRRQPSLIGRSIRPVRSR